MTDLYQILRQDFGAATAAFANADFHDMNICSNRLMSNVLFGSESDTKYMVPGYFLRVIANDFLALKDEGLAKTLRPHAERLVAEIDRAFKEELDLTVIWSGFFEYTEKKRELFMSPVERRVYKTDRAFTARGLQYLAKRFFDDPFLSTPNGVLLRALLTEADRLIRNHGAEGKELVFYSVLRAVDWLDRYVALAFFDAEKTGSRDILKNDLDPCLKRIQLWYSGSEQLPYNDGTAILCDILLRWRKYFLRYLERTRSSPDEERRVELPGQVRQRIGETIAQALQKDIVDKGAKGRKR